MEGSSIPRTTNAADELSQFKSFLELVPDATLAFDRTGAIIFGNQRGLDQFDSMATN